jgi:superfamily II DNA or RNA helicase
MVQTLSLRAFDEDAFDGFGTVLVDECHHMSAEVFSRALHRVNFRYSLGLSATLQRSDGLSHVFQWFLGGVAYRTRRPRETVEVVVRAFRSDDPSYAQEIYIFGKQLNTARMITNLCGFVPRTNAIADWILESISERPGSKVLVLSERRSHLKEIEQAVRNNDPTGEITTGFYVGGMKQQDLKITEGKRVVFGTFAMAAEGMDIPALDTLVLASPKSEIEQPVGRILRVKPDERTRVPRVIDVADGFSVFRAQAAKRAKYYRKCGYKVVA